LIPVGIRLRGRENGIGRAWGAEMVGAVLFMVPKLSGYS
jgi:hypothetical protein